MGKIVGIFQFNGAVGEAVGMKGEDGQNYARVRVRKVANPDTKGQQDARTKVSLAGKISSLTDKNLLTGIKASNARKRRSAFVANIINNAELTTGATGTVAQLTPSKLILSEGKSIELPTLTKTMTGSAISVVPSAWPESSDLEAVIVVAYGYNEDNEYVDCQSRTITAGSTLATLIAMGSDVTGAILYAIPVVRNEAAGSTKYEEALEALAANKEFAVTSAGTEGSALIYERSEYLGAVVPQP